MNRTGRGPKTATNPEARLLAWAACAMVGVFMYVASALGRLLAERGMLTESLQTDEPDSEQ